MLQSHVGIMPLLDTEIAKGKGGFKLVQYMSVGLPCISSPVGFNKDVINHDCGYFADTETEWVDAVLSLQDIKHWRECSIGAYNNWDKKFSYESSLSLIQSLITRWRN